MKVDRKLLKRCLKNDQRAQNVLYRYCFDLLIKKCYRYASSRDDAVILFNQGFVNIITFLAKYDQKQPFDNWVHRVMLNSIIDNYRRNQRHKENTVYEEEIKGGTHHHSENLGAQKLNEEDILQVMTALPDTTRKVFNLYIMEGYMHKEISEMLGISEDASKWHLSQARKKLRRLLKTEHHG